MYLGRYQLGQEILFSCDCRDSSGSVAQPTAAPTLSVDGPDGPVVVEALMPTAERRLTPGLFRLAVFLAANFSPGSYRAVARYSVSGADYAELMTFEVAEGGNAAGAITAVYQYERPNARYLVHATDGGKIFSGKNPRVP